MLIKFVLQQVSFVVFVIINEFSDLFCTGDYRKGDDDGATLDQGGSKNGLCTLKIFWEDWYAREISRFVCNKVRLF